MDLRSLHYDFVSQRRTDPNRLETVLARTTHFYWNWTPPTIDGNALSIYAPGVLRLARTFSAGKYDRIVDRCLQLSLYVDRIWLPDPLELMTVWADRYERSTRLLVVHHPLMTGRDFKERALECRRALIAYQRLYPLVDAGLVVLYPAISLFTGTISRRIFGTERYYTVEELAKSWPRGFAREALLFAEIFGASYASLDREEDRAVHESYDEQLREMGATNTRAVAALLRMDLPFISGISGDRISHIRRDSEAHADFRKLLREYARSLPEAGLADKDFDLDAKETADRMIAEFKKMTSSGLRRVGRETLFEFSVSALVSALGGSWPKIVGDAAKAASKAGFKVVTNEPSRPAIRTIFALLDPRDRG